MKKVCSFCSTVIAPGTVPDEPATHGICPDCYDRILDNHGFNVNKFLDLLDSPVLLVDSDVRVLAANALALALTGKPMAAIRGSLGGDVLECINASRPKGCGKTELCPDCTIRASVNETYTTGRPVSRRAAVLIQKDGSTLKKIPFCVSTRKDGDVVLLRLQPAKEAC
jgi:hypothetical protein